MMKPKVATRVAAALLQVSLGLNRNFCTWQVLKLISFVPIKFIYFKSLFKRSCTLYITLCTLTHEQGEKLLHVCISAIVSILEDKPLAAVLVQPCPVLHPNVVLQPPIILQPSKQPLIGDKRLQHSYLVIIKFLCMTFRMHKASWRSLTVCLCLTSLFSPEGWMRPSFCSCLKEATAFTIKLKEQVV